MEQAIIDFIIVVLGILFALFLNRINDKRKHKKRINSIMSIVIKNIKSDLDNIKKCTASLDLDNKKYKIFINEKNPDDELLIDCKMIPVSFSYFSPKTRGYLLLKDARIDFDFRDSELITDVVHFYNSWLSHIEFMKEKILNIASKNIEGMSSFEWFDSAINHNSNTKNYLDYMRTDTYKQKVVYMQSMKNIYKDLLLMYDNKIAEFLDRIIESDYK